MVLALIRIAKAARNLGVEATLWRPMKRLGIQALSIVQHFESRFRMGKSRPWKKRFGAMDLGSASLTK
jgi:hypothetical protein